MKHLIVLIAFMSFIACTQSTETSSEIHGTTESFNSYEFELVHGDSIARLPGQTGNFLEMGEVDNGMRQGFWIFARDRRTASPKAIKYYHNGKLNGPFFTYTYNGDPKLIAHYLDGKLNGTYIEYNYDAPHIIANYVKGKLDGKKTTYFDEYELRHKIRKIEHYKMGILDGKVSWFNEKGEVVLQYVYADGKVVSGGIVE